MILIGLDDTDTLESQGTGHLARLIAAALAPGYALLGVTRHQLLQDPRVPCTRKNSAAAILLDGRGTGDVGAVLGAVRGHMLAAFQPGSDPGLCVTEHVPEAVVAFGQQAKRELVTQAGARSLAAAHGIALEGLGGDEMGVIGALAAVGLAASGEDGRYVLVGRSRELHGLVSVQAVIEAGISSVQTAGGEPVQDGLVHIDRLRPARRGGRPVLVVEAAGDHWLPLKLD